MSYAELPIVKHSTHSTFYVLMTISKNIMKSSCVWYWAKMHTNLEIIASICNPLDLISIISDYAKQMAHLFDEL